MNRILSVLAFSLLVSTPAMTQEAGTFPGCTPKADIPKQVMDYFTRYNKPLPPDWCVADNTLPPEAAVPEDGAPPEEEAPPPEDASPPDVAPPPEQAPPDQGPPPPEAYPQVPPPAPVPLPPAGGYYVGPRGFALMLPGFNLQFSWSGHDRREQRWKRRGWRNGYSY